MRKKLLITGIALVCIIGLIGGTIAYRSYTGTAKNTVTASNLKIELVMMDKDASGKEQPATGDIAIMPGETVERSAAVKNAGKEACWVRVSTDPFAENEHFTMMGTSEDWSYDNGYWYYAKELASGETTSPLFESVMFSSGIDNDSSGEQLTLKVNAEATQSAHNGSSATEASGWPE